MMNDAAPWLERELARLLAPVAAPEALWNRIQEQQPLRARGVSFRWVAWPAIAVLTLIVCAGAFRAINLRGTEKLTTRDLMELAKNSRDFDFRSDDFGAIRSWVKAEASIDIDLPEESGAAEKSAVRVVGVRLLRLRGLPVAAIDCRLAADRATLLVSGKQVGLAANSGIGKHLFTQPAYAGRTRLVSWNMRNQSYAIAFFGTGNVHEACLLCHANLPGMLAIN